MARFKSTLEFDMQDLLSDLGREKQKALTGFVKKDSIKREFGNRIIDEIKDRTLRGKDKRNRTFRGARGKPPGKYSDQYKNSLPYRVHAKRDKVNLKLTGQMQASISVVKTTPTGVRIGFVSNVQENKARKHVMGSGRLPVRDFWGIDKKEQTKILKGVIKDFNASANADLLDLISSIPTGVIGELELGGIGVVGSVNIDEVRQG